MWAAIIAVVALAVSGGVMRWQAGKMQRDLNSKLASRQAYEQQLTANAEADSAMAKADLMDRDAATIDRQANAYEAQGLVDSANAQRAAIASRQQGNMVAGQGRSLAAASGFSMDSPSIVRYLGAVDRANDVSAGMNLAAGQQARTNSLLQATDSRAQAASQRYSASLQRYGADWMRSSGANQAALTRWQSKVQNAIDKENARAGLTQMGAQTAGTAYSMYAGGASGAAVGAAGSAGSAQAANYHPIATGSASGQSAMYANYGAGGYQSPYGPYNYSSLYGPNSVYGSGTYNTGYG